MYEMDTQDTQHFETLKRNTYDLLCDVLLSLMNQEKISEEDSRTAAAYVLEAMEKIQRVQELSTFLETVIARWPLFQTEILPLREKIMQAGDQAKIDAIENQIEALENR